MTNAKPHKRTVGSIPVPRVPWHEESPLQQLATEVERQRALHESNDAALRVFTYKRTRTLDH